MGWLFLSACISVNQTEDIPSSKASQDIAMPTKNIEATIREQLSHRESQISCADLKGEHLHKALIAIVESDDQPPWLPMRAAQCLIELYPKEAETSLISWMHDSKKKGLAFMIAGQCHKLPPKTQKKVIEAGLSGPFASDVRNRLIRLNDSSIQRILDGFSP